MKRLFLTIFTLVNLCFCFPIWANADMKNTLTFQAEQGSPRAKISDVKWLEGYWKGQIWGGQAEELWSGPSAGSMMASFKFAADNEVNFYEIITLFEQDETLVLRLKHFSAELKGWEDKDQYMEFKLVKLADNSAYFDGYTYRLVSPNELHVFVVMEENGELHETKFVFTRKLL